MKELSRTVNCADNTDPMGQVSLPSDSDGNIPFIKDLLMHWTQRLSFPGRCLSSRIELLEHRRLLAADLISINIAGTGPGNGDSTEASVSGDGRYVVFSSTSND